MEKIFYVYKITCLCDEWNGKFYIGSHYGYKDDKYIGTGKKIKEYFKLYGKDNTYIKEILEICKDREDAFKIEEHYITQNIISENCLNICKHTTKGNYGMRYKCSDEACKRMSEGQKGKKIWNKGIPCREETKQKISESKKGKHHSDEAKQKIGEASKRRWEKYRDIKKQRLINEVS